MKGLQERKGTFSCVESILLVSKVPFPRGEEYNLEGPGKVRLFLERGIASMALSNRGMVYSWFRR